MDYFDDEDLPEEDAESSLDIVAITEAAFNGDSDALALLKDLAEDGDLDAIEYANLAEDNFHGDEDR